MTFSDLDRLTYVSDFLGLKLYNLEIWNEYAGQFSEQFRQLELLYDETCALCPGIRQKQMSIYMINGFKSFVLR